MTDREINRRSALSGAAIVVAGGVGGYAITRNTKAAKAKKGTTAANAYGADTSSGKLLAAVDDIPDGGGKIVDEVVLTRNGTTVHAFSAVCTHQGCLVDRVSDGQISCPCHGSRFDATTGEVTSSPASKPLPSVTVTVRDGKVYTS